MNSRARRSAASARRKLADRCIGSFSAGAWQAGSDFFRQGLVVVDEVTGDGFRAFVHAGRGEPFGVTVDLVEADDGLIRTSCTCSRFDDDIVCEHVAACLMEADEGQVVVVVGSEPLEVVCDDSYSDVYDDAYDGGIDDGGIDGDGLWLSDEGATPPRPGSAGEWRARLAGLARYGPREPFADGNARQAAPKPNQLVWYRLNLRTNAQSHELVVDFCRRRRMSSGEPGPLTPWHLSVDDLPSLAEPLDRELVSLTLAAAPRRNTWDDYGGPDRFKSFNIAAAALEWVLPRLCATGRFGWVEGDDPKNEPLRLLAWDDGPPLQIKLLVERGTQKCWVLKTVLWRGGEKIADDQIVATIGRCVIFPDHIARLAADVRPDLLAAALHLVDMQIPVGEQETLVETLAALPHLPPIELPDELRWPQHAVTPVPRLSISASAYGGPHSALQTELSFDYDGVAVHPRDARRLLADKERRRLIPRDLQAEHAARAALFEAGAKPAPYYNAPADAVVPRQKFPSLVAALTSAGWQVVAEGKLVRRAGSFTMSVSSGVDWFELDGQADYEGTTVGLPELLAAAKRGDRFVTLGDGSQGMLPDEWLARYAPLAKMGEVEDGKLRFKPSQALLLDAWLSAQPEVDVDRAFDEARQRLRSFQGIQPHSEPRGFTGALRPYQREGLGWLMFLEEFGFGGCLADDMGLGKTIQVLAMFAERRARAPDDARPSLVVVPRSLVQNWREEARRFTPDLRVLDYTGLARDQLRERFAETDLVITTYGTLRRDAGHLKDVAFDFAVLDEAQAIKNSASQAAKACRLISARHRLAMTGTPVENHLGELWSIMEFLNPGMLGRSNTLKALSGKGGVAGESVELLGKALRPFILRRTKRQVLSDLPDKTEQTLYCELEARQRKLYNQLRDHYRQSLSERIKRVGIERAKIHVLEALLRLRQAACHPALIDASYRKHSSAKLETLIEQLSEVLGEGHKALVFSQFTSLLALVRRELDDRGWVYEYLDGQTRDRQARVDRFQQDPDCPLFLISLKAGGLGLNLTAADYVFILDPWWNPAVEAQAVDRAHRIGQTRRVFAYRLIARDTVEEKILELQGEKRKLADAIVSADNSLIGQLTSDDLTRLLS